MDFFNTSFYDKASGDYSDKRYNGLPESFIQFFFQRRLKHVLNYCAKYANEMIKVTQGNRDLILLEDGCADGVVAQMINKTYPDLFSKIIGTDISPGMIDRAKSINKDPRISFTLKNMLSQDVKADVLLAVGFVSPG